MESVQESGATLPNGTDLIHMAEELNPRLARMGAVVVTLPLFVLPADTRDEMLQTTTRLFEAVGKIHLGLTRVVINGVGAATGALVKRASESTYTSARAPMRVPIETGTKG